MSVKAGNLEIWKPTNPETWNADTDSHERDCSRPHFSFDVAGRQSAFFQILLVIVLGGIESHRRHNLGDDRLFEAA